MARHVREMPCHCTRERAWHQKETFLEITSKRARTKKHRICVGGYACQSTDAPVLVPDSPTYQPRPPKASKSVAAVLDPVVLNDLLLSATRARGARAVTLCPALRPTVLDDSL